MLKIEVFSEKMGVIETIYCDKIEINQGNPTDWVEASKKIENEYVGIALIPANRIKIIRKLED